MIFTIDLTDAELDCMLRALARHVRDTTHALRAQTCAQLSIADVEQMHDDVRVATTLAGRLPLSPRSTEHEPA